MTETLDVRGIGGEMADLRAEPKQLQGARRCGAHARTTGKPCMAPAVRNKPRCRMHGCAPGSGGQFGARKHGRYTREAQEARAAVRELVHGVEVLVAATRKRAGLKVPEAYRRRKHVVKALAEAKARKAKGRMQK